MIARLRGRVWAAGAEYVIVDVGGVGYRVEVSSSTRARLPAAGEEVTLHVHTSVREDAIQLYGFLTAQEHQLFVQLLGVSGVGPRLALAILGGLSPEHFYRAVQAGDASALTRVPGIGKKTAQRLLLELRDRLQGPEAAQALSPVGSESGPVGDAVQGLVALGYGLEEATAAVQGALSEGAPMEAAQLVRAALRRLGRALGSASSQAG